MRYFLFDEPVRVLIRAEKEYDAIEAFKVGMKRHVHEEDLLTIEFKEISRDRALVMFSRADSEEKEQLSEEELVDLFNKDTLRILTVPHDY